METVKIHRTKEVFVRAGAFVFPVADYRCKMEDTVGSGHDVPPTEAPDLVFEPLAVEEAGFAGDGAAKEPQQNVEEVAETATTPEAPVPEAPKAPEVPKAPGSGDVRGAGEEDVFGRRVRKYKGSSRPPGIDPAVWNRSAKAKTKAMAE